MEKLDLDVFFTNLFHGKEFFKLFNISEIEEVVYLYGYSGCRMTGKLQRKYLKFSRVETELYVVHNNRS